MKYYYLYAWNKRRLAETPAAILWSQFNLFSLCVRYKLWLRHKRYVWIVLIVIIMLLSVNSFLCVESELHRALSQFELAIFWALNTIWHVFGANNVSHIDTAQQKLNAFAQIFRCSAVFFSYRWNVHRFYWFYIKMSRHKTDIKLRNGFYSHQRSRILELKIWIRNFPYGVSILWNVFKSISMAHTLHTRQPKKKSN